MAVSLLVCHYCTVLQGNQEEHNDVCEINTDLERYIDNVKAYIQKEKIRNKYTGSDDDPDERMMRSIEDKINIVSNSDSI